jgi:hypothetical protein
LTGPNPLPARITWPEDGLRGTVTLTRADPGRGGHVVAGAARHPQGDRVGAGPCEQIGRRSGERRVDRAHNGGEPGGRAGQVLAPHRADVDRGPDGASQGVKENRPGSGDDLHGQ